MALEVEKKFLDVDFSELRTLLEASGARCAGLHFEYNLLLDTPAGDLASQKKLLRIRSQRWSAGEKFIITYKGSLPDLAGCKVRDERELEIADAQAAVALFAGLGYEPCAHYEKWRESWTLNGVEIELDTLPFADIVELEGPAEEIERLSRELGLDKKESSTKSYYELFRLWCQSKGIAGGSSFDFATYRPDAL